MAILTMALDGASYRFLGFGTSTPCYEKGPYLDNYSGSLTSSEFDRLLDDCLVYFYWMRSHVIGGEHFRENAAKTKNYPHYKQAEHFQYMNERVGPFRYIGLPFSAPSSTMLGGNQTTYRGPPFGDQPTLLPNPFYTTEQNFNGATADWQAWLEAQSQAIKQLLLSGCAVEFWSTAAEAGSKLTGNWWSVDITASQCVEWIRKIWLGEGMTGGGLKARYPWIKLICSDTAAVDPFPFRTAVLNDATALAAVDYFDIHHYSLNISAAHQRKLGIVTDTSLFGRVMATEFGWFVSGETIAASDANVLAKEPHDLIFYGRVPLASMWTPLRDVTAKAIPYANTVSYTAKPLADLDTAAGTFAFTPLWWALKPYLLACGRGEAEVRCGVAFSTTDANFDPATGVFMTHFHRVIDSKQCTVYGNFSGGNRADTIYYTSGGAAATLSGTKRTYSVMASSVRPQLLH